MSATNNALAVYENLKQIGNGSFGKVYMMKRKTDGKVFAYKKVRYATLDPKLKEMIHNEVHVLSTIRHPHVVAYATSFNDTTNEILHIMMEYCPNGDLSTYIKKMVNEGSRISEPTVWSILDQLSLALFRCHHGFNHPKDPAGRYAKPPGAATLRVLHRDLKPENVFLCGSGVVKLGDFGLCAVLATTQDMRSTIVGTPFYMAPEVANGQSYSTRSETWSLGCIGHELVTLKPTFYNYGGVSTTNIRDQNSHGYRTHPQISDAFSSNFHEFVKRCFSIDPAGRPSIQEILEKPDVVEARGRRELNRQREKIRVEILRESKKLLKKREEDVTKREVEHEAQMLLLRRMGEEDSKKRQEIANRERAVAERERALQLQQEKHTRMEEEYQLSARLRVHREKELEQKAEQEANTTRRKLGKGLAEPSEREEPSKEIRGVPKQSSTAVESNFSKTLRLAIQDAAATVPNLKHKIPLAQEQPINDEEGRAQTQRKRKAQRAPSTDSDVSDEDQQSVAQLNTIRSSQHSINRGVGDTQALGEKGYTPHEPSKKPKIWRVASLAETGSVPMDVGETFYLANGLVPFFPEEAKATRPKIGDTREPESKAPTVKKAEDESTKTILGGNGGPVETGKSYFGGQGSNF